MECLVCKKELSGKQLKFCGNKCQQEHKFQENIFEWKTGTKSGLKYEGEVSNYVRRYLHEKYNSKCHKCGWGEINPVTGKVPLTVNHIDGDSSNNRPENLELICPNCHSLTHNYGSLNRGNGRKKRLLKLSGD